MTLACVRRPISEARPASRNASEITYTPLWKNRTTWRGSIPSTVISAVGTPPSSAAVTVTSGDSGCADATSRSSRRWSSTLLPTGKADCRRIASRFSCCSVLTEDLLGWVGLAALQRRFSSPGSTRRSAGPLRGAIRGLEVVAVADRETGERSPDGGHARLGPAGQDHHRQKEAQGEDPDRPPERRGVAVNCRGVRQAGRVEVAGRVAGDGAGEDRAQQGGPDRAADLLGGVDHRRGDPGFASLDAQ